MVASSVDVPKSVRERLIVALDVSNARAAQDLVRQVGDVAGFYKVGLQLFAAEGRISAPRGDTRDADSDPDCS